MKLTSKPSNLDAMSSAVAAAGVKLVGIDTPSIDHATDQDLGGHHALYEGGVAILENLDLSACQPLQDEVPQIVCDVIAAGLVPTLASVNVDGVALPVRLLNGSDKAEVVDMAGKRLGLASGLVIAALIGSNSSAKALRLANNPLRDEGIAPAV